MNKAFVRESDDPSDLRCPACRAIGTPVGHDTLAAHLPPEMVGRLGSQPHFCPNPRCDAGYFDGLEQIVPASEIHPSIYPKNPSAQICPCLGITAEQVESDARAADPARIRKAIAHAALPEARCATLAACGHPCTGEIQRLYIKTLSDARK